TDAMLSRAGTVHGDGARGESFEKTFHLGPCRRIIRREDGIGVEVAVTYVANDRRDEAVLLDVLLRFDHALSQSRNRHADVGGEHFMPRPGGFDGPVSVVTRLPEPAPIILLFGPVEADGAFSEGDFLELLDLVACGNLRALKFEEEGGAFVEVGLRVVVHRIDLHLIEQLHARHTKPELDRLNDGIAGAL